MRRQRGLDVPNPDSMKTDKVFIPDKYNNRTELRNIKRVKYSTTVLLELRAQGFSDEVVSICANITATVKKMIVCHKALPTYR